MITLQDIIDDLVSGELSQFSFAGGLDTNSGVQPSDYPVLIRHLNRSLMNLFTRFCLKEREVAIDTQEEISFYILDSKYAQSNSGSTEPIKWIADTAENPFTDDIIRIQRVFDEANTEIPINDDNYDNSVYLPTYKTLQVPSPANDTSLFITYRAKHPYIDPATTDLASVEVEIPEYCVELLLTYISYRVYTASSDQNDQAIAAGLFQKFEVQAKELEDRNVLYNTPNDTNMKLEEGGWI